MFRFRFFLKKHLRKKEGLDWINLSDDEFNRDLETGKFTVLVIFSILRNFNIILRKNKLNLMFFDDKKQFFW